MKSWCAQKAEAWCGICVQGRCEQLEKQVEWVKSERDEAQKVAEASAARVKELETAASRQKGHRKDDSKKAAKESKAAIHKAEVWPSASICIRAQV